MHRFVDIFDAMQEFIKLQANMASFNRRYYLARAISGLLVSAALVLALSLILVLLAYAFQLNSIARAVLFYGFSVVSVGLFVIQTLVPLLRLYGLLPQRSMEETAHAIQRALPQIEDRLVNAMNLNKRSLKESNVLLEAGLQYKALALNEFRFADIIDLRAAAAWFKYTMIPLGALVLIAAWNPSIIKDGAKKIILYNQSFQPPAPFQFKIENQTFSVPEGEDFVLNVTTEGNAVPEQCFVLHNGAEIRMKRLTANNFEFVFEQVNRDFEVKIKGASVYSQPLQIKVLPKPKLLKLEAQIRFPDYLKRKDETALNVTNYKVPEGSEIVWKLYSKNAEELVLTMAGDTALLSQSEATAIYSMRFLKDAMIRLEMQSQDLLRDSALLDVQVIKDEYPKILVEEAIDTISGIRYFRGDIADDYGISKGAFVVEQEGKVIYKEELLVSKDLKEQRLNHVWNPETLGLGVGESVLYYFQVADNDGINGPKTSNSIKSELRIPSKEELLAQEKNEAEKTQNRLDEEKDKLREFNETLDEIRKELLEKKKPDWEEQERLKDLLREQQEMMQKLENRAQEQKRFKEQMDKMNPYSDALMEKQKLIQEMFESLFDEEFKDKYREYQEMLEEMNKEQMLDKLDEMKLDNETLEKELDRTLELFKELEFEQKLEENLKRIQELKENQDKLKQDTENRQKDNESLQNQQKELQDDLKRLEESIAQMEELNKALEDPKNMPDTEQEQTEAEQAMEQAKEELQKGNEKKAGQQQKGASEALQKMEEKLSNFQQQEAASQQAENLEDMRQLLENIVDLSIDQEEIMEGVKRVLPNDPKYISLAKDQKKVMDDTKVVEDSLLALSKRVPQIDRVINEEISKVKHSMEKGLVYMTNQPPNQEQRYIAMAAERQQYAMTSLNNLAVLFDEIISQMQQQMAPSMKGSGDCKKPGSGQGQKPSASDMKKMQESLNKQLQKLKEAKEKGENAGGKKPGSSGGAGMGGTSKELARMAAEQAAIRQQLRQMSESLGGDKSGKSGDQMKELERMMEETEEDILFNKIDAETMRRQQDILTRLLESEKAEREREFEEQREAQTNYDDFRIPDEIWEEFKKEKEKEVELYKTLPPSLKPFYRNEVNRYFSTMPLSK